MISRKLIAFIAIFFLLFSCKTISRFEKNVSHAENQEQIKDKLAAYQAALDSWDISDGREKLSEMYLRHAKLLIQRNQYKSALTDLERAVKISENLPETIRAEEFYYLSITQTNIGNFLGALESINSALELNAENSNYRYQRSIVYLNLARYEAALFDIDNLLREEKGNSDYLLQKIRILIEKKDFALAKKLFPEIPVKKSNWIIFDLMADVCIGEKNYSEAFDLLEKAEALEPDNVDLQLKIGNILEKLGRQDAILHYEKALTLDNKNSSGYFYLGRFQYKEKNYDKCISLMNDAIKHDQGWKDLYSNAHALLYIGLSDFQKNMFLESVDFISKSIVQGLSDDKESYALAYEYRSKAYQMLGEIQKSKYDAIKLSEIQQVK